MLTKKIDFNFFALGALGKGLSGSDRIFIEFARRWSRANPVNIYVWTEGYQMCERQNLEGKNIIFKISTMRPWKDLGFFVNYFARIFEGLILGLTIKLQNDKNTILYSASDFWMDNLPCVILKMRFPKTKWIATWYQTAPNPFKGYAEGDRIEKYKLSALLYWLSQLPIKPLISNFADFVLVNNEEERKQFPKLNVAKKVVVVLGAVDLEKIENWKLKIGNLPKVYDAVFQGRLHPQKGVLELVEIWKKVVHNKENAKLAIIGDGPLMQNVKLQITNYKLEKNVKLFGYVFDGPEKYKIFSQSKVVVHPAFYDSGGMAAAEAMAFELPCVGFDLKSYISYYPKGMVKVRIGDLNAFSNSILELISNDKFRKKIGFEGLEMIRKNWSWDKRSKEVLNSILL
jgi:glycosyltransferase involved in cell wall biosynthesis